MSKQPVGPKTIENTKSTDELLAVSIQLAAARKTANDAYLAQAATLKEGLSPQEMRTVEQFSLGFQSLPDTAAPMAVVSKPVTPVTPKP